MDEKRLKTSEVSMYGAYTFCQFLGIMLQMGYAQLFMTNVLAIDTVIVASAMMIGRIIDFCLTLVAGGVIQSVQLKGGKYRPWISRLQWIAAAGIVLSFLPIEGMPVLLKVFICMAGYTLMNGTMNFIATCQYGIMATMTGTSQTDRLRLTTASTRIGVVASMITSFSLARLITFFGNRLGPSIGYFILGLVSAGFFLAGLMILNRVAKPYDLPTDASAPGMPPAPKVTIKDMIRCVVTNDQLLVYMLANLATMTSMYVVSAIGIYYYLYIVPLQPATIFSDPSPLVTSANVMLLTTIFGFFAAMVGPRIGKAVGKYNSRTLSLAVPIVAYILIGLFASQHLYIYVAILLLNSVIMYIAAPYAMMFIMDIGEYGLWKSGIDNRSVTYSMANVPMKIGMALGGAVGTYALAAIGFKNGATFDISQFPNFTKNFMMLLGFIPAGLYSVALLLHLFFYKIKDADAIKYSQENMAKMQAQMGGGPGGPGPGGPKPAEEEPA